MDEEASWHRRPKRTALRDDQAASLVSASSMLSGGPFSESTVSSNRYAEAVCAALQGTRSHSPRPPKIDLSCRRRPGSEKKTE